MLDLTLCLDPGGPRPLYQQLYDSLAAQISHYTQVLSGDASCQFVGIYADRAFPAPR